MADIFREIDDELRRDKASQVWERYQKPIIAIAVLIVLAAGGWRFYEYNRQKQAQEAGARFESALQLSRDGKGSDAEILLNEIAKSGPPGYALLARFKVAGESAARDPDGAVKMLDAIAADTGVDATMRDVARLRAAILRVDKADAGEVARRLEPMAQAGQPFRASARELLAVAALKRNDYEAAGKWLDMIVVDNQTPGEIRQRAEALLGLVGANKK